MILCQLPVDSTFESVSGHLVTGGSGDQGVSDVPDLEDGWGFDLVPIFLGEWVDDLLLSSLFGALCESLVLAYGHVCLGGFGSKSENEQNFLVTKLFFF